jgi:hypothetical protein
MRAKEFLIEKQELDTNHKDSISDMVSVGVPGSPIGPTNYYHKYRLGVHMAGSPDDRHSYPTNGEFVDHMVMAGYSDADRDIIANSIKAFGYTPKKHASGGSKESKDTHTVSPVSNWMSKNES